MTTQDEWTPWIKIVNEGAKSIDRALASVGEKSKLLIATALSAAKWVGICRYETKDYGTENCALCRVFNSWGFNDEDDCADCLLHDEGMWCGDPMGWYDRFCDAKDTEKRKKFAVEFRNFLIGVYAKEYARYN